MVPLFHFSLPRENCPALRLFNHKRCRFRLTQFSTCCSGLYEFGLFFLQVYFFNA